MVWLEWAQQVPAESVVRFQEHRNTDLLALKIAMEETCQSFEHVAIAMCEMILPLPSYCHLIATLLPCYCHVTLLPCGRPGISDEAEWWGALV